MDQDAIIRYVADTFPGVDIVRPRAGSSAPEIAWGDTFFIYDPQRSLEGVQQFPFATIVTKDYGDFDRASNLDRPGVFRLNIGVGKETYRALFGRQPPPPGDAGHVDTGHDFAALDRILPHPVYAPQSWVCILNPGAETFEAEVRPLLADAYELAVSRLNRRENRE